MNDFSKHNKDNKPTAKSISFDIANTPQVKQNETTHEDDKKLTLLLQWLSHPKYMDFDKKMNEFMTFTKEVLQHFAMASGKDNSGNNTNAPNLHSNHGCQ